LKNETPDVVLPLIGSDNCAAEEHLVWLGRVPLKTSDVRQQDDKTRSEVSLRARMVTIILVESLNSFMESFVKNAFAVILLATCTLPALAQDQTKVESNLQEAIQARYRITVVGPSAFGLKGGDDSIRKLGGAILVMKKGMYGAIDRKENTSNSIRDGKRTLLSGKEDVELQPGDRLYANSVRVGSDYVSVGLLSVDPKNVSGRNGRVWATANFFFKPEVISGGDIKTINAAMDQWLLPADSLPGTPPNAQTIVARNVPALPPTVDLKPGMSRDEVIAGLGNPAQTITFANKTWLAYPALVALLEDGKLTAVDRTEDSAGTLSVNGEAGAEIYVDGELAGTTPASLRVPVGSHKVEVKSKGTVLWGQDVRVFPGAEVNVKTGAEGK
jgi:hypothetical protein